MAKSSSGGLSPYPGYVTAWDVDGRCQFFGAHAVKLPGFAGPHFATL
jgi:hypothetical protein